MDAGWQRLAGDGNRPRQPDARPDARSLALRRWNDAAVADGAAARARRRYEVNRVATMRFRFTLRELLLTSLILALCVGWWFDHKRLASLIEQKETELRVFMTPQV